MDTNPELTINVMMARNAEVHPWRPESFIREMAPYFAQQGIPWCAECADWHHPSEDHSATDGDWVNQ